MIIYRPHRGSFEDAMKKAKEFETMDQMKNSIVNDWDGNISKEDIVIDDKTINDSRNGWKDTRNICTKRIGNVIYDCPQCIGMCASDY